MIGICTFPRLPSPSTKRHVMLNLTSTGVCNTGTSALVVDAQLPTLRWICNLGTIREIWWEQHNYCSTAASLQQHRGSGISLFCVFLKLTNNSAAAASADSLFCVFSKLKKMTSAVYILSNTWKREQQQQQQQQQQQNTPSSRRRRRCRCCIRMPHVICPYSRAVHG